MKAFNFPVLRSFPKQRVVLGRILLAYAELEMDLCGVVSYAHDLNIAIKALYRMRGEGQRIQIADGLARQVYAAAKLETVFSEMIADMTYATGIRNQYAHCVWNRTGKKLSFLDMEAIAYENGPADKAKTVKRRIDLKLLRQQETFFAYVQDCLLYLQSAIQAHQGIKVDKPWPKPAKVPRPPKYRPEPKPVARSKPTAH